MQIALYARVSTARQFENALSVPDQLAQMRNWAERHGHIVVKEYIEPGASATDDKRPVFQDMVADAMTKPAPFQMIVVHSFSRFFRDMVEALLYEKKLAKNGVKMASITQHINDDPAGEMQKRIIMLFDEYQSKETAKHVLRSMKENARQGYFNGARAPYGYKPNFVGQTGSHGRMKKKLVIEESEAETVRQIFTLYVHGKNGLRKGIKEIAKHLNTTGVTMRDKSWGVHKVHKILSSSIYAGTAIFNRTGGKLGQVKDKSEWVKIPVPAIIDQETFQQAAKIRDAYSPKKSVPRRESSPTLLIGLVLCGHCGAHMTVATGKSGRYRYYKCSKRMSRGNTACKSSNVPLEKLDNQVLDAFRTKIYTKEHVSDILAEMRKQSAKLCQRMDSKQQLKKLESDLQASEQALTRIYEAVEQGFMKADEHLKTRLEQHQAKRETLIAEIAGMKRQQQSPFQTLTPQKIERVVKILNQRLTEASPYAKAYLKATLSEIRIKDETMTLTGPSEALANLIANNASIEALSVVPSFMPEWRRG